jgi:hypothetical protein
MFGCYHLKMRFKTLIREPQVNFLHQHAVLLNRFESGLKSTMPNQVHHMETRQIADFHFNLHTIPEPSDRSTSDWTKLHRGYSISREGERVRWRA